MFELFQLRCFVAVAEELHFGRAAQRLFMTQPPLSRQIQLLEHALGVRLLERSTRAVVLTAAGKSFYTNARLLLKQAEQAATEARRIDTGEAGRVTLGFTAVTGYGLIPDLLGAAKSQMPQLEILLKEMVSLDQIAALNSNLIDLGFIRPLSIPHAFATELLFAEPLMLAVHATNPLARKRGIKPGDLDRKPLIMHSPDEGKYFYNLITALLGAAGVQPTYVQYLEQNHTILSLVRKGLGMAIVPASAKHLQFQDVVFKPLWKSEIRAEIFLAWRADSQNPALQVVREFAMRLCRRHLS
ncbi:transcriptional regulator, LysR family [Noviherbaspirillum humi]|uniref:Transcriptional regulator, LysR family n=1 Tax=Noviherbaspirillum humi TaxID=1688639 RepID=A0A239M235_9BURK|nr:LysR family transcriptional regulator [Noviherbaspirillum humi]SNT36372.1 transcriptional regulator, LysR family [Noviherbaspirillum humi]